MSPEERREFRRLLWSKPVLPFQLTANVGVVVTVAGFGYLLYLVRTGAPHSGIPAGVPVALGVTFAGLVILGVGFVLRTRTLRRVAFRPCLSCGQVNLWTSAHCRRCGAALPPRST